MSFALCCGSEKNSGNANSSDSLPSVAELKAMDVAEACPIITSKMVECKTDIVRTVRVFLTAQGQVKSAIRAGHTFEKSLAKPPETLCADKNAEKETTVAIECVQSDCEKFAECLVKVKQGVGRAKGENVPRCEDGDIAYEASKENERAIWCVHNDGVPHGPWQVWEGHKKRIDGMYKEGRKDGEWTFHQGDRTETQRYVDGEHIRDESNNVKDPDDLVVANAIDGTPTSTNDKRAEATDLYRLSPRPIDAGSPANSQVIPTSVIKLGPIVALNKSDTVVDELAKRIEAKYFNGIKRCHQRALKTNPKLSGQLTITMKVSWTGRVTDAAVSGFEPSVDACVRAQAQRWRFASPKLEGKPVEAKFRVPLSMTIKKQESPTLIPNSH